MSTFYVYGDSAALTGATTDKPLAQLWNPHSTRRIKLVEASFFWADFDVAGYTFYLAGSTARGTPGSTVTPDADNSSEADGPPPSGALLDLAQFTVFPTLKSPPLVAPGTIHTASGGGFLIPLPRGLWIPPGQGVVIVQRLGSSMGGTGRASFVFED